MENNAVIDVQITHPKSNDPDAERRVDIRITDKVSGIHIVAFSLTAAQFVDAISSTYVSGVAAQIIPEESRWKINRRPTYSEIRLPSELEAEMRGVKSNVYSTVDLPPVVSNWLGQFVTVETRRTSWRMTHHNYGWSLHLTSYEETSDDNEP
jgi:hypothetical protein